MAYTRVYIHFIFSTKNRKPFLDSPDLRKRVWRHIKDNSILKKLHIDVVNGYADHCHCLVSMSRDQTLAEIMHLINGESAYWINKNNLCKQKFEWQDQYFAISVSQSMVGKVREYILNQENHHRDKDFQDEHDRIVQEHDFLPNPSIAE